MSDLFPLLKKVQHWQKLIFGIVAFFIFFPFPSSVILNGEYDFGWFYQPTNIWRFYSFGNHLSILPAIYPFIVGFILYNLRADHNGSR
jgi:hypothetical protein